MSDDVQPAQESPSRELEREERRLIRLRRVIELHPQAESADDTIGDFDPDPKEAA